ncbi:hypothetical protein ACW9HQ_41810, partial [Nocardia gipuzkoensis]
MSKQVSTPPAERHPKTTRPDKVSVWRLWLFPVTIMIVALGLSIWSSTHSPSEPASQTLGYSQF